jgi:hypothetical protein
VRDFLGAHDVDFAHASSSGDMSNTDVGALARRFTVRVECGGPAAAR